MKRILGFGLAAVFAAGFAFGMIGLKPACAENAPKSETAIQPLKDSMDKTFIGTGTATSVETGIETSGIEAGIDKSPPPPPLPADYRAQLSENGATSTNPSSQASPVVRPRVPPVKSKRIINTEPVSQDEDIRGARLAEAYYKTGLKAVKAGRYKEAARDLKEALSYEPDNPLILSALGSALVKLRNFKEARPYLTEALRLNPSDAEAQANLDQVLAKLGVKPPAKK